MSSDGKGSHGNAAILGEFAQRATGGHLRCRTVAIKLLSFVNDVPGSLTEPAMPPRDDDTGYSGDLFPRRRPDDDSDRGDLPRRRAYDDDDDEPLPRPSREREYGDEEPAGVVTSLGTVGIVFGILHVVGALVLCLTGTLFAGMFVGMGQLIVNDPNVAAQPGGKQQQQQAADMCNGFGLFSGAVLIAPAIVYVLAAIGLLIGGWGTIKRRSWGRVILLFTAPLVLLLDSASFLLNPISGSIAAALALGYGIFAYIVLLMPQYADEFS
jgi:hypothetical protein